jgi:hypothetical protein
VKIDIRSDKSLYVEIDDYTVYIDTSLADGIHINHWNHWYGDEMKDGNYPINPPIGD